MESLFARYFSALVRHETLLWALVDRTVSTHPEAVSMARFQVLQAIADRPGCRVQDLADALRIRISAASRIADRLVASDLISKSPNPEDRRSSMLRLTVSGEKAHRFTRVAAEDALAELLGTAGEETIESLIVGLRSLDARLLAGAPADSLRDGRQMTDLEQDRTEDVFEDGAEATSAGLRE